MRPLTRCLLGVVMVVLAASGCQSFNFESSRQVHRGTIETFPVDAPDYGQNVKVTVSAPDAPVSVYVVLDKDSKAVGDALFGQKKPDPSKVLASQENTQEASVDAKIPAKNAYTILVYNGSMKASTQIKIKIKGS